jgi:ABC-type Mn2+/Zn2+ transport system permease subunit
MMRDEVIIGIIFAFFMALAVLFIGLHGEYSSDINSILFGNILLVDRNDLLLLAVFSFVILLIVFLIKKELYFITFNQELAKISGIPVNIISYLFLVIVSITISVSLKAIGAILVFAMIVTPAAAAYQWTFKLNKMIILSTIFGVLSSIFGLFSSYILDLPSGSTIVIIVTSVFLVSFAFSPKRISTRKGHLECPYCREVIAGPCDECHAEDCAFRDIPHSHEKEVILIDKKQLPERERTLHKHDEVLKKDKNPRGEQ